MQKNEIIKLTIVDMTNDGLGIGKSADSNQVFFVKNAIVGDVADCIITKITKNIIYATVKNIIEESQYRVSAKCNIAKRCGGCIIQEIAYKKQLFLKEEMVKRNLQKIGGFNLDDLEKINEGIEGQENNYNYRNKIQVPFSKNKSKENIYGFYAKRSHDMVPFENCEISFSEASEIIKIIYNWCEYEKIEAYNEANKRGLLRHVLIRKGFASSEIGICLVINDNTYPKALVEKCFRLINNLSKYNIKYLDLNLNMNRDNVILAEKIIHIYGDGFIKDEMSVQNNILQFKISTKSFYQINTMQAQKVYTKVIEYLCDGNTKADNVLDLYCGIGTISLFLANYAKKVIGIEVVDEAIQNAKENARINGINNVEFFACDVSNVLTNEDSHNDIRNAIFNNKIDTVVVDPPRKGLDENAINLLQKINSKKIIYVSCDSATLSRDLKILKNFGYDLAKYKTVDMFPHTMHVETVCLLDRA